jgi:hypothetical protein
MIFDDMEMRYGDDLAAWLLRSLLWHLSLLLLLRVRPPGTLGRFSTVSQVLFGPKRNRHRIWASAIHAIVARLFLVQLRL